MWETITDQGTVIAITQSNADASLVPVDGRQIAVYTLDEIARLLAGTLVDHVTKEFPGSKVVAVLLNIPVELINGLHTHIDPKTKLLGGAATRGG